MEELIRSTEKLTISNDVVTKNINKNTNILSKKIEEVPKKKNNETYGMSLEYAICEYCNIENKISDERVIMSVVDKYIETIKNYDIDENNVFKFSEITEHIGHKNTFVDFKTKNGLTISVKTNINGSKVCPQKIGQCTKNKWCEYFDIPSISTDNDIKNYIVDNTEKIIKEYYKNLFCCDITIYWNITKAKTFNIIHKNTLMATDIFDYTPTKYTFTHINKKKEWNESSTLKINKKSIGEFQIHNNRNCIKFRFHFANLSKLLFFTAE